MTEQQDALRCAGSEPAKSPRRRSGNDDVHGKSACLGPTRIRRGRFGVVLRGAQSAKLASGVSSRCRAGPKFSHSSQSGAK
jgi:hypothetical protein